MSYYRDGGHHLEIADDPAIRTVGWLGAPHPVPQGNVGPDEIAKIWQLIHLRFQPVESEGWETCTYCFGDPDEQPIELMHDGKYVMLGANNIYVPAGGLIYVAPDQIIHYIEEHGYGPPADFLEALRKTDPASDAYKKDCERLWKGWGW